MLDFLFPPRCVFCRRLLKNGESEVCGECRKKIRVHNDLTRVPLTQGCAAPLRYEGDVRSAILRFKFRGLHGYAVPFARFMSYSVQNVFDEKFDLVTFVPSNRITVWKRGYNQAELLASRLSASLGIPCVPTLKKVRRTAAMNRLTPSQRRANIRDAIGMLDCDVSGKVILLTDDILTTGATMTECARVLLNAGAAKVCGAVCAKSAK